MKNISKQLEVQQTMFSVFVNYIFFLFTVVSAGDNLESSTSRLPPEIRDAIDRKVASVLGSLDNTLGQLMPDIGQDMDQYSLDNMSSCYAAELDGKPMNIFNSSAQFRTVATDYYVSILIIAIIISIIIKIKTNFH